MNFKLTMVLAFVAMVLILGATLIYKKVAPPAESSSVFPETMDQIVSFRFKNGEDVQVAAALTNDKWVITEPMKAPANSTISSAVDMIKDLKFSSKFDQESKSLSSIGLETPRYTVEFTDSKGVKRKLFLGKTNSAGNIYARVEGDPAKQVYVLSTNPLDSLDKDPSEFRNMQLASINPDDVQKLTIEHHTDKGTDLIELERKPKGWEITKPLPYRADAATVSNILSTLQFLKADKMGPLPVTSAASGLTPATLKITAWTKETPDLWKTATAPATAPDLHPVVVTFGAFSDFRKTYVYAATPDSTDSMLVTADVLSKVDKDVSGLRDPVIMPVDVTIAAGAHIFSVPEKGKPEVNIVNLSKDAEENWTEKSSLGEFPADDSGVTTLLRSLKVLRANKFVTAPGDLAAMGLNPPMKRIVLDGVEGHQEELLVGEPQTADPLTPVMRKGDDTVYMVQSPELVALGTATPIFLRDKTALKLDQENLYKIKIEGPEAKHPVSLIHAAGKWDNAPVPSTQPATQPGVPAPPPAVAATQPDISSVLGLIGDVVSVSVQKWNGPDAMPARKPDAIVTITTVEVFAPKSAPATAPTPSPTPATATAPATAASQPATMPTTPEVLGPIAPKETIHQVLLFKGDKEWTAYVLEDNKPGWAFVPAQSLIDHATTIDYTTPPPPSMPPGGGMGPMGGPMPGGGPGGMPGGFQFGGQ